MYYKHTQTTDCSLILSKLSTGKQPVLLKVCIIEQEGYSKHQL